MPDVLEDSAQKIQDCHSELINIINKHSLSTEEILVLLSNFTYTIGGSIAGYEDQGPSLDELRKIYYSTSNPDLGVALMLQGYQMANWYNNLKKKSEENTEE